MLPTIFCLFFVVAGSCKNFPSFCTTLPLRNSKLSPLPRFPSFCFLDVRAVHMLCQQILGLSAVVSIWLITSFDKRHHSQQLSAFGNTLPYPLISNCQHLRWPPSQMTWYVKSPLSGVNVKKCERILYHPLPLRNGKLLLLSRFSPFGFFSRAAILGSHLSFCPGAKISCNLHRPKPYFCG